MNIDKREPQNLSKVRKHQSDAECCLFWSIHHCYALPTSTEIEIQGLGRTRFLSPLTRPVVIIHLPLLSKKQATHFLSCLPLPLSALAWFRGERVYGFFGIWGRFP